MKSVRDVLLLSTEYLQKKGTQNARYEAENLLADFLGLTRLQLYLEFDRPLQEDELECFRNQLIRRAKGEPAAYIYGEKEFYGLKLKVDSRVLIPRQETELLVEAIVKDLEKQDRKGRVLADLCCGSGCIGLALKKTFPELNVLLSDISISALEVARQNAEENGLSASFLQGDLFEPFAGKKVHYLVCNPPYISEEEFKTLDPEVASYEPRQALVAGTSGLEFYQRIASELRNYLEPEGFVWLEIGYKQGDQVIKIFQNEGWSHCRVEKDLSGHDRFFSLENQ